jgi:hypothetical protein
VDNLATPNRDLASLRPDFRAALARFLAAVEAAFPGYKAVVHEAHRSQARQDWIYQQGRTRPGQIVTWTRDSNHLYGIAADWHVQQGGKAIWDAEVYKRIYAAVPPELFGLETLAPTEYVHVQLANADKRRHEPPAAPAPKRLLIMYAPDGSEAYRGALPDGVSVRSITTVNADGSRVYIRPEIAKT